MPNAAVKAAKAAGAFVESVLIFNPWRANPEGRGSKPWEGYTTLELFDAMFKGWPPTAGCTRYRRPGLRNRSRSVDSAKTDRSSRQS